MHLLKELTFRIMTLMVLGKQRFFATPPSKDSSGIIIAFNESTGDLITGDKQKKPAFDRFKDKNYLGAKSWMSKWSNKINKTIYN
jgi:hypothetical protein